MGIGVGMVVEDVFRRGECKRVNRGISQVNTSFKTNRNWNGHSEQNKVKEMKRLSYPYIKVFIVPSCTVKYLRRKKQKSMSVLLVQKPSTSGKSLWVLSQNNFVSFTLQSPGHTEAKYVYLTCSVHAKKQRTWEFTLEAAWEVTRAEKEAVLHGGSCIYFLFQPK